MVCVSHRAIERDAQLPTGVGDAADALANGCTCEIVHGDLLRAALDALARPERPEYVPSSVR